ncbi:MAG: DUF4139 domain-containing protein [Planctomycetes bacterium]|nr:DUF4139 domain-containing protein [Planctomycetota bacterium]
MKHLLRAKHVAVFAALAGLICCLNATRAEDDLPKDAELRIEKVSLFKNGLGFLSSTATLPENATSVRFGQIPAPSFGTFWVGYPKDLGVRKIVTSMEEFEAEVAVKNLGQLLKANVGRKVTLRTGAGDGNVVKGTILTSFNQSEIPEPSSPYSMGVRLPQDRYGRPAYGASSANILLLKTDSGTVALNVNSIVRADFEDGEANSSTSIKQKRPSLRMELDSPSNREAISISYLARGVTWTPAYLIDLSDAETARFSARALIINELADFKDVRLELVTGFPNIKFGEVISPVAMSQNLAAFLQALATGRSETARGRQHMLTQQRAMTNMAVFSDLAAAPVPSYSTAAEGRVSEDLFLYPVKNFTLKKGETAWVPLFTAEMPYEHIYTWKIADSLDKDDRYRGNRERGDGEIAEEVWHSCRLVNNLKMPLTTAATEFVTDGAFTGQDVCFYTAPGAKTTIRINRAMNLVAEEGEVEIERARNATKFHGYSYDLVKVRGELRLQSRLDKSVNVEVTKELSGNVLETSPNAKDVKTAKGLKKVNSRHVLTWQFALPSGKEQKLSYVYSVYIRN